MCINVKIYAWIFILFLYFLFSCSSESKDITSKSLNGDLNETFIESSEIEKDSIKYEIEITEQKNNLIKEGWEPYYSKSGIMPDCYNFVPTYDKSLDNYLELIVGGGTDVAVKLLNYENDKCIRYVFVNRNSSYKIQNIPEGKYYLKIAYGKDWISKVEGNKCIGKFLRHPEYEIGVDVLDFNLIHQSNSYSVPYYILSLDIVASDLLNSFNSKEISESEFNK